MMESTCTRPSRQTGWGGLRALVAVAPSLVASALLSGCVGINGLPSSNSLLSDSAPPTAFPLPSQTPTQPSSLVDGNESKNQGEVELIANSSTTPSDRYTARQFPDNYGAPQPSYGAPSNYSVQPSAPPLGYSAPPSYTAPPTYTPPPTNNAVPSYAPPTGYGAPQPTYGAPQPNYGAPSPYGDPGLTSAPGYPQGIPELDGYSNPSGLPAPLLPEMRTADLVINGYPARTGRIMFGGAVNSDAGVTGQITVDERNFDITRFPRSFQDLFSGTAFRGAGQTFRVEAVPGNLFQRYTAQFADPNLFGYLPISMSISGFLYDRRFNDWDEQRLGGRLSFGYRVTPDLSVAAGVSGQNVNISRLSSGQVAALTEVEGDSSLFSGELKLIHDTRDSPIQASQGHYFEFKFEETFGDFQYSRFDTEYRKYFLLSERADRSGKQTLSFSTKLGFSGDETPIFENYFAGGYATMRGFDFRGASPAVRVTDGSGIVETGGRFQWLNTAEYMFPITADDAFRGVAFVDFGTVETSAKIDKDNFRVAPGVGLRVAIPMLGPAPLAFDFAYPVAMADTDQRRIFSFYMSLVR